jgi:ATP-dependent RNA helicase DHX37/DHR1
LPNTFKLQSSSTLGSGRVLTTQDRLEKTEDKEIRRAIYSRQRRGGHLADTAESDGDGEVVGDAQDVHSEGDTIQDYERTSSRDQVVLVDLTSTPTRKQDVPADIVVGGALQRNADGSVAKPRIMKKKGTSVCLVSPLLLCNSHLT